VWQALDVPDAEATTSRTPFSDRLVATRRHGATLIASIPIALAVVVGVGILLRAVLWSAYEPVVMNVADTAVYISMDAVYDDEQLSLDEDLLNTLTDLQHVLRLHPILMLQAFLLAGIGAWLASGRVRAAIILLAGASLLLILIPSAIGTYNARYAIPIGGPLVAAGALGLWVCIQRLRGEPAEPARAPASGESSA
jgi:hypothetical protein